MSETLFFLLFSLLSFPLQQWILFRGLWSLCFILLVKLALWDSLCFADTTYNDFFSLEEEYYQYIGLRTRIFLVRRPWRWVQVIHRANWRCLTVFVVNVKSKEDQWSHSLFPGLLSFSCGRPLHSFGSPFPFVFWLPFRVQLKVSEGRDSNIMFRSPLHKQF